MQTASLHGVEIAWTRQDDNVPDLVTDLGLSGITGDTSPSRGRIEITLRHGDTSSVGDPAADGAKPSFYQGIVKAYAPPPGAPRGFVLWDQRTRVHVHEGGGRIEVDYGGEEVVTGSARATLEIAVALALRDRGFFHVHAAAVLHPSRGPVLLVGASGAGKTTATIALVEAGYGFIGDDALLLDETRLCSFPRPFHLGPATLAAFPRLEPFTRPTEGRGDKRQLDPALAFPGRHHATSPAPVLALYPRIEREGPTRIEPLPAADALGELIGQSGGLVIRDIPRKHEHLALLTRLTNGARHAELCLGRDLLADPSILARVLDAAFTARPS